MARVKKGCHCFTCHQHVLSTNGLLVFTIQPQSINAPWLVPPPPLRVGGWVGLDGWLQTEMVLLPEDGHPPQY